MSYPLILGKWERSKSMLQSVTYPGTLSWQPLAWTNWCRTAPVYHTHFLILQRLFFPPFWTKPHILGQGVNLQIASTTISAFPQRQHWWSGLTAEITIAPETFPGKKTNWITNFPTAPWRLPSVPDLLYTLLTAAIQEHSKTQNHRL